MEIKNNSKIAFLVRFKKTNTKPEKLTEEIRKRGPKTEIFEKSLIVKKDDVLNLTVPNFGVEVTIDNAKFNAREFNKLFPNLYSNFNILLDYAQCSITFNIPWNLVAEHDVAIKYREKGTFKTYIYNLQEEK